MARRPLRSRSRGCFTARRRRCRSPARCRSHTYARTLPRASWRSATTISPRSTRPDDGHTAGVDNTRIADQLEALAGLLELADANPYSSRAYRRAADTVRAAPTPVADLVRSGRVRRLRGIGPSIEAKLRELVETGAIAELAELERELAPDLVGFGRYLGLTAKRTLELARALDVRTAGELRDAALAGRLRSARGVGPRTEARLLEALARAEQPRPRQGLLLNRARELLGAIAQALGATVAGDARRWRDVCEHLAVVCAAADPRPVLTRFVELPQIVALLSAQERCVVGLTVEGLPVELVVAAPE